MLESAARTFHTVRHLKPSQLLHRGLRAPKRVFLRRWGPAYLRWVGRGAGAPETSGLPRLAGASRLASGGADGPALDAALERARAVVAGRLSFLGHEERVSVPLEWDFRGCNLLWRYTLHGFGFVEDLALLSLREGSSAAWECFRVLITDWIRGNPCGRTVGWDPYPTSRRIVSWIHAARLLDARLAEDDVFRRCFCESLAGQVRFLARNQERHLGGNHLWENCRAVALSGFFFGGAEGAGWRTRGLTALWAQVREQVLPDGGHFERCPHYHLLMLESLLETKALCAEARVEFPADVDERLRKMVEFTRGTLHPDGGIPQFNDSVLGAVDPIELLEMGAILYREPRLLWDGPPRGLRSLLWFGEEGRTVPGPAVVGPGPEGGGSFPSTGLHVLRGGGEGYLILDAGPLGPDFLPGHGHADTLSFELSLGGRRFVVDSGVGEYYGEQSWRDYDRGTAAHSTVEIDGRNQSDVWSQFRVGRRARPGPVGRLAAGGLSAVRAGHDGYRRLRGSPRHARTVLWAGSFWLVVDEVAGAGEHRAVSRVHLHPECAVDRRGDLSFLVERGGISAGFLWAPGVRVAVRKGERDPIQGWVAPEFGRRLAAPVLEAVLEGPLPAVLAFAIVPSGLEGSLRLEGSEGAPVVRVEVGPESHTLALEASGLWVDGAFYPYDMQPISAIT